MKEGVEGAAGATMAMDEALATAALSFEGRSMAFIDRETEGTRAELVEDMAGADMIAFYEGFTQGARCTLHLRVQAGRDPHYSWRRPPARSRCRCAAASRRTRSVRASRPGVKGTLD